MIYRCTTQFVKSFDQLPLDLRTHAAKLIQQCFTSNPRMPASDTHVVRGAGARADIYTMCLYDKIHMTFAYVSDQRHANDFVCVFRNIGLVRTD